LPPGGCYFGCRTCYNLTCWSVQQHDQRVDDLSQQDWPELGALLKLPFKQTLVVHKAIYKKQVRFFKSLKSSRNQFFDSLT
jgi:pyruvate-formate lyase-activating enzyme